LLVSGSVTFHPTPVHVPSAVEDVVTALAPKARSRGIDVRLDLSDERADVVADARRFRQVLINFLGNALKFSHEGGVVHVRTRPEGPLGLRVEIEDHGIGIAEGDLPNLFSQFSQLSAGNTKIYEGTGLGLALVRRLVESQGGEVGVRSTLGVGSVFHFSLPGDAAPSRLA
jgi:signal transduction histidine kinase